MTGWQSAGSGRSAGRRDPGGGSRERGAATIWVLAASGLVLAVTYAVVLLASVQAARQRADAAADLAALAGARAQAEGADACATGRRVAAADQAQLDACDVAGPDVAVTASVRLPPALRLYGGGVVRSRARAGPVAACLDQPCESDGGRRAVA